MTNKYFVIQEFVPPSIYRQYGASSFFFLDPRVVDIATAYREWFDAPVIVNNWHTRRPGNRTESGYRVPNTQIGGYYSQHKFGRAFDCYVPGLPISRMWYEIADNYEHFKFYGLTTLENYKFTPAWVHSDCRWHELPGLLIVNP